MSASSKMANVIPSSQRNLKEEDVAIKIVTDEGKKIYADFIQRMRDDKSFSQLESQAKYDYYMKQHPDFARSSPIVLRYITFGMFSEKAVWLYMKRCFERPVMKDEDYCDRQADFVKFLYHVTTNIRGEKLNDIWREVKEHLMKEIASINEAQKQINAEREQKKSNNAKISHNALKAALLRIVAENKAKDADSVD